MKGKAKFMSMLLSTLMISSYFSSLAVKAAGSGANIEPTPVGQPITVNGVTSQEYEIKIPYYDDNVTDNYYELGATDTQTVLSRVPNQIKRMVNGQQVTFKATNVEFNEDGIRGVTYPKPVPHTLNINCGVMDYALYQYKEGGYSISPDDLRKSFKTIPMDAMDKTITPGGDCNSNEMLVWAGIYSNDSRHNPIFACEPYQLFYPPTDGSSSQAQLRREPYEVTSELSVKLKDTSVTQGLIYQDQPITIDLPQGQNINPSQSYDFYAICSNDLKFTYNATDGINTYNHTSYTTLSNPMTLSDLQYFYPDYKEPSPYFFKNNLCSIKGSAFKDAGTVIRSHKEDSKTTTETVHRYVTNYTFGYIQPSATYTYTSLDHLFVPTVTYTATVQTEKKEHNLTVHYIDKDAESDIDDKYNQTSPYNPSAPSNYELTGNYRTSVDGTDIAYSGSISVDLSNNDQTIYVMCRKSQETGTVVKKYFLDGIEQTADKQELKDVPVGSHTYSADKDYSGYTCSNPSVTVDVKANDTVYANFNYTIIPVPVVEKGTVIKRYFLKGVEQTADRQELKDVPVGPHTYSTSKTYPRYTCENSSVTVNVTANSITYCDFNYGFENHPPTVHLYAPPTVVMGDNLEVNASSIDPDGDPLRYEWYIPSDFKGSTMNDTSSGYFESIGNKTFSVTVTDPFNASGYDSTVVKVVPPVPNVVIAKNGTEKENRKVILDAEKYSSSGSNSGRYPLDWSKAQWQFFDGSGNELTVDNNPTSSTIVKSLDSTIGSKNMDLIFKKAGKYTAKCTLYNTAGYSNSFSVDLNIIPDLVPTADFYSPDGDDVSRNPQDLSPNGLSQASHRLADNSKSSDDNIGKRMWLACFDSDNDGSYDTITNNEDGTKKAVPEKERWYVFDLNYNGDSDARYKVQVPDSTPLNGKLVTIGADGHKYAYGATRC